MSTLNIKNPETCRLVHQLAELTGESMTAAVTEAVRERLARVRREKGGGLADRLMEIGRDCASRLKEPYKSIDHGELLYRNDGFIEEVSTSPVDPLVAELEHFLQCVRGLEKPAVDGPQASRALLLADLIEQCVEQANICMTLAEPI